MEKTFISARCDADLAEEFALLARARGESTSGFLRMAMQKLMAEHQEDDPAEQGEAASINSTERATSDALPAA